MGSYDGVNQSVPPTQVDDGWEEQRRVPPTQVDDGWEKQRRGTAPGVDYSGLPDLHWTDAKGRAVDVAAVMASATCQAFRSLEEFKAAAAGLRTLCSARGLSYEVKGVLNREGGESILLRCSNRGGATVAKLYYHPVEGEGSSLKARMNVLKYMQSPAGREYALPVVDLGTAALGGGLFYFEIMPFCPEGDLSGDGPYDMDALKALVQRLNEALHSIHDMDITHRDVKPSNLFHYQGRVVLGDFGMARMAGGGLTQTAVISAGFTAPEALMAFSSGRSALFTPASDYYSLGVTLACLFEGRFVYQDMSPEMIMAAVFRGQPPLLREDPRREELENLLRGLCSYNFKDRFQYEQVSLWLENGAYAAPLRREGWPKLLTVSNTEGYQSEEEAFRGFTQDARHWIIARNYLYGGQLRQFFADFRPHLSALAQQVDEDWRRVDQDRGLAIFLKGLYPSGPLVWKGYSFRSLGELAVKMRDAGNPEGYGELLQKRLLSHWLDNTPGLAAAPETRALVDRMEEQAQKEPARACYWFGNSFSREKEISVSGRKVHSAAALLEALFASPRRFFAMDGYQKLGDRTIGSALYGFLDSLGYQPLTEETWERIGALREPSGRLTLLLGMLDQIARREQAPNRSLLSDFCLNYGPLGIAVCTRELVREGVYEARDGAGRELLRTIRDFALPQGGSVEELQRSLLPLEELVDQLRGRLQDNPFLLSAGVYEEKDILCKDLRGCFAYRIYGRSAPLGFQARLEREKGGEK